MPRACAGLGILLSVCAVVLLVFSEIGQINSSTVPKHIRIITLDTSGVGAALAAASQTSSTGLYYNGTGYSVKPTGTHDGLRTTYEWGFWGYCAGNNGVGGDKSYCTRTGFGSTWEPLSALYNDLPTTFEQQFNNTIPKSVFTDEGYLSRFTHGGQYIVFIGAVFAALAMLIGFLAKRFAFFVGAFLALIAALAVGVGLAIYTILVSRVKSAVNGASVAGVPLGITVNYGNGLWIAWAAAAALFLAVLPYLIACCVGRNRETDTYKEPYY